jgi:hypothetical protein
MKPGLWEITQRPELDPQRRAQMEKAQQAMANMPAAQRQQMEQMMAQRGLSLQMNGGTITLKTCVTAEQAARHQTPVGDGKQRCSQEVRRSGNVIHTQFACPESGTEGEAVTTLSGAEGFASTVTMRQMRKGKQETSRISGSGRWLGSDCGAIKPMPPGP